MRSTTISRFFIALTLLTIVGLNPLPSYAQKNDDLKTQIKALNDRIAQLEKQLAEKNAPPMAAPPSVGSSGVDAWDPFSEMQRMRAQMNQLFQDSFDRGFGPGSASLAGPQTDIKETSDSYVITMDLPGMEKDKINVEVKNGMLVVSGDRSEESQVNGNQFYRQERTSGHFVRALPLPNGAKPDDIKADYKNGVLEIRMGRVASSKPQNDIPGQRIPVE